VCFEADVFIMDLSNYNMVLGVQWLSMLGDILCNYKHLWMSFDWQGQRVLLKGESPIKFQAIELAQLQGLLNNSEQVAELHLCSLQVLEDDDLTISSLTVKQHQHQDTTLTTLLENYSELFQEPEGLPSARGHDHIIPLKEGSQPVNLRPYRYSGL
jgi:hypothetical protein